MKDLFRPAAVTRISFAALLLSLAGQPLSSLEAAAVDPAGDLAQWPQLRGPGGQGVIDGTDVPLRWSETENVLWKTPIEGRGHSAPIVWGDRIFLTTAVAGEEIPGAKAPIHIYAGEEFLHPASLGADKKQTLKVIALDAGTGEIVWSKVAFEGQVYDNRHDASSYASPTAVTDGERVYTYFGSQGVYAWDFDGNQAWSADIGQIKTVGLGVGTSPVLYKDFLILQINRDGDATFIKAGRVHEVLASNTIDEGVYATPAITRDRIYIRSLGHLYAIGVAEGD